MREPTPSSAWEDAARYDRWYDTPLGAFVLAHELAAVQHLVTPQAGEQILEVGCGTGRFSLALAASGATVVGVDASASAITYAAQHTPQGAHVRYVVADTEQLPFADDAFDVVVCILALEFIAHPPTAVAELRRVLKPSGRLVIGVLGRWSPWNLWRRLRGAMGHPLWQHAHFFRSVDITNLLQDAGFQDVRCVSAIFLPPMPANLPATLYRLVDACGRWCCPWAGAFIAVGARKCARVE